MGMERENAVFRALADPSRRAISSGLPAGRRQYGITPASTSPSPRSRNTWRSSVRLALSLNAARGAVRSPRRAQGAKAARRLDRALPSLLARSARTVASRAQGDGRLTHPDGTGDPAIGTGTATRCEDEADQNGAETWSAHQQAEGSGVAVQDGRGDDRHQSNERQARRHGQREQA